jgi:hypothetical protein
MLTGVNWLAFDFVIMSRQRMTKLFKQCGRSLLFTFVAEHNKRLAR